MKRLIISAGLILAGASAAQSADLIVYTPPVIDETIYADVLPAQFYFSIEALALWRSSTDTDLYLDTGPATDILVSTRDIAGIGMGWGARFALGGPISDQFGWQIAGFLGGNFTSSGTGPVSPSEDLYGVYTGNVTPGNLFFENSDQAYAVSFSESSSIGGIEASGTFDVGGFRVFAGPRYIRYQAALNTTIYDDQGSFDGLDSNFDRVGITSTNHLIGGQIGIEGMAPLTDVISFGGRASVGLYANHAVLDRSYAAGNAESPFATQSVSASSSANGLAASFELSPKVALAVTENVDVTLGGTLLFLQGVDEPGNHLAGIGAPGGGGQLAADAPGFGNNVHFAGLNFGLQGTF